MHKVFRRRTPKTWIIWFWHLLWPDGGWNRAFEYIKYRMKRLPDSPKRISIGISAGVFASFTPFYGLHFFIAIIIAKLLRGNMLAALSGTFFGNPLTYVPIGVISLSVGHFILGTNQPTSEEIIEIFVGAWDDFGDNLIALYVNEVMTWTRFEVFLNKVLLPYSIGCIIPGLIASGVSYYLCFPLILAFKNRRQNIFKKLSKYRKKDF
jgi:hypothetical protein